MNHSILSFEISGKKIGFYVKQISEIIIMTEIYAVPNVKSYILGVTNLRGDMITIIDLSEKLGVSSKKYDENSRIIIVEYEKEFIGIAVNTVVGIIKVKETEIKELSGEITVIDIFELLRSMEVSNG